MQGPSALRDVRSNPTASGSASGSAAARPSSGDGAAFAAALARHADPALLFAEGRRAYAAQAFAEAAALFARAAEAGSADPVLFNYLGAAWQMQGRLPEAARAYRAALQHDPAYADAADNLAAVTDALALQSPGGPLAALALAEQETDTPPAPDIPAPFAAALRAYAPPTSPRRGDTADLTS